MRFIWFVVFGIAWLTIYCNSPVLSLPPSFIANAASLRQQQQQQQQPQHQQRSFASLLPPFKHRSQENIIIDAANTASPVDLNELWKKDNRQFLLDPTNADRTQHTDHVLDGIVHAHGIGSANTKSNSNTNRENANANNANNNNNKMYSATTTRILPGVHVVSDAAGALDLNRKWPIDFDLNTLLTTTPTNQQRISGGAPTASVIQSGDEEIFVPQEIMSQNRAAMGTNEFFTPLKYWVRHCQTDGNNYNNNDCPEQYYRTLFSGRNKATSSPAANTAITAALKQRNHHHHHQQQPFSVAGTNDDRAIVIAPNEDDNENYDVNVYAAAMADRNDDNINVDNFDDDNDNNNNDDDGDDDDNDDDDADDDNTDEDITTSTSSIDINDDGANNKNRVYRENYNNNDIYYANIEPNGRDIYVNNDDVLMLLNGEQNLIKFLHWAMKQLYPYEKFVNFSGNNANAEYYHPSMYIWKQLNLSGRLEPPLFVEEPRYIIVRREQLQEDLQSALYKRFIHAGSRYRDDPFIPPRGRKTNLPDLDALLNRLEPFVPNRGRRDKIKDIFKYDDLFYPNRGKKQKPPTTTNIHSFNEAEGAKEFTPIDYENLKVLTTHSLSAPTAIGGRIAGDGGGGSGGGGSGGGGADDGVRLATSMKHLLRKLKRRLRQQQNCMPPHHQQLIDDSKTNVEMMNNNNNNNNVNKQWLDKMSTLKINGYDQSVKSSMPTNVLTTSHEILHASSPNSSRIPTTMAADQVWHTKLINARLRRVAGSFAGTARIAAANRLHATRSMSTTAMAQKHRQQMRQQLYQSQQQQQRHRSQIQQQQQNYRRPHESQSVNRYKRRIGQLLQQQVQSSPQQYQQVKSFNNFDVLLWQLLQQNAAETLQQPQETQLTAATAAIDSPADDIDYTAAAAADDNYLNI